MHSTSLIAGCWLLFVLMIGGCSRPTATQASSSEPEEFQSLLDASRQELERKTEANQAWGLGTFDRWDIDQEVGVLVFSSADGTRVVAPAQVIGSFITDDNSWLWAWDNPSIVGGLKLNSLKLKEYGEQHGIEKLTTRKWTGTEADAWAMTALAVKLCGAQGAYRGPAGSTYVFMTFGEVNVSKPDDGR
jgi:hypothetical protein